MSTSATIPMLAPNGQSGEIPADQVNAALAKGFKRAVTMTAPNGSTGYIPEDKQQEAMTAGFKALAPAAPEQKSLLQRAKESFDENTAYHPNDPALKKVLSGMVSGAGSLFVHPVDSVVNAVKSAGSMADGLLNPPQQQSWSDTGKQIPYVAGQAVGGMAAGEVGGAALKTAIPIARQAAESVADTASSVKQYVRPKPSPAIVAPEELQAQKIAQSILPPGGIKPELLKSIQKQAPAVVEYAKRTGNPLNTQAEGLKAAQGVAQEGLEHYQEQILKPVSHRSVVLSPEATELGGNASIGEIDSRITEVNKLINTDKASSQGAALDVLAKSKWADEVGYLRDKLYSSLEHTTGIPKEDLQFLREGYGGEFSLADQLEAAQNARLTRTGQQSQGVQTIANHKPSLMELPMQVVNKVRGGEQAIADRQFAGAMREVQPQAPVRPTPPPIDMEAMAAHQAAAQQEFLHSHNLQQAAQESAAGRTNAVQAFREEQASGNRSEAQQEFLHQNQLQQAAQDASAQRGTQAQQARTINRQVEKAVNQGKSGPEVWASAGKDNIAQHLQQFTNAGVSMNDLAHLAETSSGKELLMRASSITPGTPMMKALVSQILKLKDAQ